LNSLLPQAWAQRARALRDCARSSSHPVLKTYRLLAGLLDNSRAQNLNVLAAGIGLYAFLALLPFTASMAVIYGIFAQPDAVKSGVRSLLFMAPARSQDLVADRLVDIIGGWNGGPQALIAGLLLATYAAARAARSILSALNLIHGLDRRRFVRRWTASLAICLAGGLVTLLALLAIATSSYLGNLIPDDREPWLLTRLAFWSILAASVSVLLALLYRYAPNGPRKPWRRVIPGAVAASILWLAGSVAFTAYVPVFARYDVIYGSLAAVVVLQLWLYASAFILLLGAQLNVELQSGVD
jgi:membrane protein